MASQPPKIDGPRLWEVHHNIFTYAVVEGGYRFLVSVSDGGAHPERADLWVKSVAIGWARQWEQGRHLTHKSKKYFPWDDIIPGVIAFDRKVRMALSGGIVDALALFAECERVQEEHADKEYFALISVLESLPDSEKEDYLFQIRTPDPAGRDLWRVYNNSPVVQRNKRGTACRLAELLGLRDALR